MANHTIVLTVLEESIYQAYLTKTMQTDAQVMTKLHDSLASQVIQFINEAGSAKFNNSSITEKLVYLG